MSNDQTPLVVIIQLMMPLLNQEFILIVERRISNFKWDPGIFRNASNSKPGTPAIKVLQKV